ncbi:receptor-type protein kinase, putative [Bodo saltans]|uniref:Receptor-type protein kinase, putative n=1 Tax=Bodo saltans TaxID=75058 RepID=A0A0S4IMG2_BODSA|nr:receptor-type protein kinase, putative [Bodo saltans]|eukprot:CUE73425.1 receptor-type protein kinase, putative [Bodo saltans]
MITSVSVPPAGVPRAAHTLATIQRGGATLARLTTLTVTTRPRYSSRAAAAATTITGMSSDAVTDAGLQHLAALCHTVLRCVTLLHCAELSDLFVASIATSFRRMELLNFDGCARLGDETMRSILSPHSQSRLTVLCFARCVGLTDQGIQFLTDSYASTTQSLTHLNLTCCNGVTAASIPRLASLSQLKFLDLTGTAVLCTIDMLGAAGQGLGVLQVLNLTAWRLVSCAAVLQLFPQLQKLTLDGAAQCLLEDHIHDLPPPGAAAARGVQSLSLQWSRAASVAPLAAIVQRCTNLTHLALSGSECVTDAMLSMIATTLHHVHTLELQRVDTITDRGVGSLVALKHLRHLDLMGCAQVAALEAAEFQSMQLLTFLNVAGLDGATHPTSFMPLASLMRQANRLQTLLISANFFTSAVRC